MVSDNLDTNMFVCSSNKAIMAVIQDYDWSSRSWNYCTPYTKRLPPTVRVTDVIANLALFKSVVRTIQYPGSLPVRAIILSKLATTQCAYRLYRVPVQVPLG